MKVADLRKEYTRQGLSEEELAAEPWQQFARWFQEALDAALPEPNAMTLATVSADGCPRTRVVLLKGFDARGFVFFTNYESTKGRHLATQPVAALNFHWAELERQVCLEGRVTKTTREESEAYFCRRPRGSQIGAWVSQQSEIIPDRAVLETRRAEWEALYQGELPVPLPPHWGGYRLEPHCVEFWQGRPSRLHDRLRYVRLENGGWRVERLSP